jgi:hypothetical protein
LDGALEVDFQPRPPVSLLLLGEKCRQRIKWGEKLVKIRLLAEDEEGMGK